MNEDGTFERIIASLHEAALDPARWPGASLLIDEALGTHGSSLVCADGESVEDIRIYLFQTYIRGERHPELERLYLGTYYPLDERVPRVLRSPFNRLFHITDFYTEEELKTSEAYNALRTLAHAGDAIEVRLRGSNRMRILWQVNDPVAGATGRQSNSTGFGVSFRTSVTLCACSRLWPAPRSWGSRSRSCSRSPGWASSSSTGAGGSWR